MVPARNVLVQEEEEEEEKEEDDDEEGATGKEKRKKGAACLQREWEEMVEFLEAEIESSFPFKRWIHAKNLLRELLRCPDLCITADYKLCFIKEDFEQLKKLAHSFKPQGAYVGINSLTAIVNKVEEVASSHEGAETIAALLAQIQIILDHAYMEIDFVCDLSWIWF